MPKSRGRRQGRFDLPGRFAKIRKRREPDGKKEAALNIFEFERILVEIIMDINREPVESRRIPPDALVEGAKVASRIGFYEWGLTHRPGFTREMGPHFAYEHLLTKANATVRPNGIHVEGEVFNCDRLRELGYLVAAVANPGQTHCRLQSDTCGRSLLLSTENATPGQPPSISTLKFTA
jgi:hypothetical protein